ncbi:MAG: type II toxin-antitoxin system RelE/ParE family toxin [Prevotellaceae bacterium]|jgi:plasmid stabilization system protein ParE|nr:type II toxin-antitoxin system RelE/ParE family toxin [Prevotellaceae bacterium]
MEIIWLPLAEKAIDDIFGFYAEKNVYVARKIVSDILRATERLSDFPEMAAVEQFLQEQPKTFRSLVVKKIHKVVYYIETDRIYIADVWDCRQNPEMLTQRVS